MKHARLSPQLLRNPVHFLALGFGAGLSPWAPGTAGTLVAVPLIMFIGAFGASVHAAVTVLLCVSGMFICDISAKRLGVHDHPGIVWDEIAGFSITMLVVPHTWYWLLAGFVVFRFLDIVKPWPIREADHRLRGGLGIMLDDMMAGVIGAGILYGLNTMF
ncbi:MAG: phosphatidylglycerophosphatase A [Candidatus Obscuribacterales bacterium]|nr:phosphatidylglycerophosphatase A [Steroidobacteraceae bacterium]